VDDDVTSPAVVRHPALGRLLIFDPTDPYTQIGDLPASEQGSLALIDHKDSTELLKMPVMPADTNRLERNIEVDLGAGGNVTGRINEKSTGQAAVMERARVRRLSTTEYKNVIEGWVSRGITGAKTTKISPSDNVVDGTFSLDVDFNADTYAQLMQGRLMVFKPAVIGRLERLSFSEGKRSHPFVMEATAYSETVKIKLPAGFSVDELPEQVNLDAPFGQYAAKCIIEGDHLVFTRSLRLDSYTVPPEGYDSVRSFFGNIRSAEQTPVVLMQK
jgi:hypothetical protein